VVSNVEKVLEEEASGVSPECSGVIGLWAVLWGGGPLRMLLVSAVILDRFLANSECICPEG